MCKDCGGFQSYDWMYDMKRYEWNFWTDNGSAGRRAGGRRRYNAQRRRQVEARREALVAALGGCVWLPLIRRGAITALAQSFGVSPSTISRDLQYLMFGGKVYHFCQPGGELSFSLTREYPGGPVLSITDADDYEIQGRRRERILRNLPRYTTTRPTRRRGKTTP